MPDATEEQSVPSQPEPLQLPNERSKQLLEMDETDRNTFFTMVLRGSNKQCDHVIRTIFGDAFLGFDEWEALCKDHNSYSLKVTADPDVTITSLHCRELSNTSKMLLQSVGGESKASGCRMKTSGESENEPAHPQARPSFRVRPANGRTRTMTPLRRHAQ